MTAIELLRELAAHADPGAQDGEPEALGARTLRFVVEYAAGVDVDAKRDEIRSAIDIDGFQFFPLFETSSPDPEFGEFYVLQFPGLERTVDNPTLFSIAHELQEALGAVTVEPDLGSEFFREPLSPDAMPEGVLKDLFRSTCFVPGPAPADRSWALDRAGVLRAWKASPARGAGVRIAQPDTGVTQHAELSDVAMADGFNVLTGAPDPTDPLAGGGNPGHGTGTASVMTSGPSGVVLGSAPEATLVPIRCVESVVLTFNGGAVAKAIDHARRRGCHVVTMSLGGTPSRALKKSVKQAIQSDMIVLAAAGNCVNLVVYPARYDEVIAVAGSNVDDGTWRGSCSGSAVDVTAPGEKVWKAVAGPDGTDVGGGQGTSFAVAITAGVAALWLSHHGHQAVKAAAVRRRLSVQALFREVLMASARVPAGWDTDDFGAGIVDAEAVLRHPLDGPGAPVPEAVAGGTTSDTLGLLAEAWGPVETSRLADVAARPQLQLELCSVVYEDARLGVGPSPDVGAEGAMARQGISPELEAALGERAPAVKQRPLATSMRASLRTDDIAARDPVVLVAGQRSSLESAGTISVEAARESLRADSGERLGALEERVARVREGEGADRAALTPLHDQLLRDSEVVLDRLREDRPIPKGPGARTALEALVQLDDRPALRLSDDGVDPNDPQLGVWQGAVVLNPTFADDQQSVGRIDAPPGVHVGTGFVVGEGLVMTNRHVLEAIAFPTPGRSNPTAWVLRGGPVINFSPTGTDPKRSFKVTEVAFSGPDPIDLWVDLAHLDLALLRIEQTNAQGAEPPRALRLSDQAVAVGGARMFVVGYPALPTVLPTDSAGKTRLDVIQRLREIYGMAYGVRYLSPGEVMTSPEQLADSPLKWAFSHDATSLGGNSGSCVMSLDNNLDVAGLHFAGDWLRANYAHAIDQVRPAFAGIVP